MNISSKSKRLFDTMLIGLLVLVGVYLVGGATSYPTNINSTLSNVSSNYTANVLMNWTRAGYRVNITFTINATGVEAINNITIKIPANFTLRSGSLLNYTGGRANAAFGVAINFTSWNSSFVPGQDYYLGWIAGDKAYATWRNLPSASNGSFNTSCTLCNGSGGRFVAEFTTDSLPADGVRTWTIYLGSNDSAAGNRTVFTYDMGIDVGEPVVNGTFTATDGTNTLDNATQDFNGTSKRSGLLGNMLTRKFLVATPQNNITINFTVIDPNLDTVIVRIATENTTGSTPIAYQRGNNYTVKNGWLKTPDNISFGVFINDSTIAGLKTGSIINFVIIANDTIGKPSTALAQIEAERRLVAGIADAGFNFSIVREAPMILSVNNTVKQNWRYSGNVTLEVSIWSNGTADIPRVYWRYENGTTSDVGAWNEMTNLSGWVSDLERTNAFVECAGNLSVTNQNKWQRCNYTNFTATIDTGLLRDGDYNITFKAVNTITNISATANVNSNLTTILNFTVDNDAPSQPTITISSASIETGGSTTLTCSASTDTAGSPITYYIWVKRPGDTVYTMVHTGSSTPYTNTGVIGTYAVKCEAKDDLSHSSFRENTAAFTTTYGASGSSAAAGAGGAGETTTAEFDVDLSDEGLQSGTIKATAGTSKTLSFDGSTTHKITVTAVTEDSATIKIESEPVEITLKVGESKEVDINGDDVNDIKVELKAIKNAEAEVEITELVGAATVAQEEVKAAEEAAAKEAAEEGEKAAAGEEVAPTAGAAKGTTWIWVTAVIIVIVIVVGVILAGKKKKK